ncbi:hypothetical protein VitviT2T_007853 [Vitis vinifera]|uniref:Uncharacterized protein n=2 Tax=Vitis vinifera TaxID=29760 RepID=A0ABY9C1L7_VITVI|nr:uncharacterized protein LOC100263843 [Vitis vinifera]WJZ88571.1 hypothetical protein VitviT2T_007853 [Vitis vinifera]|eukprot:XP_002285555.1 PREDICTED: uncharacterized protein LOC100263843 [Vitis vinifera]
MTMDRGQASERVTVVLSIECLKGSSKGDEWTGDMLQTGDIVEEIKIGNSVSVRAPFKNGKVGVQRLLHSSFKSRDTSIQVRVRRGDDELAELQACIVPNESAGKKQYMLRAIDDPNYAVGFCDRTESECFALQASRNSRMVSALTRTQLQDGYVAYPWGRKMQEFLSVPNSSCFLSILLLPKSSDRAASRYNDLEDTLARANAWLTASQSAGVPVVFMNIHTESLLTKISGETASSTVNIAGSLSDLANLANASLYGFEDYHGVDIGVVRAVRLWYAPLGCEFPMEIKIKESDTKLGFAISRTEEGFIYISSVIDGDDNAPSTRSGLSNLYKEAMAASKLLVVSRVSNQKVLPWMVSSTGAIRCFDTVSLSQKLSLHRHAKVPILIHVFLWNQALASTSGCSTRSGAISTPPVMALPPEIQLARQPNENQIMPLPPEAPDDSISLSDGRDLRPGRDTAGDVSFRFHDFALPNNWV